MTASDLRCRARISLTGNYWPAVLAAFIASIFGALLADGSASIDIDIDAMREWITGLPTFGEVFATLIGGTFSVISIAVLVLGGVVQLGYAQYLLKQHDGAERDIKDLFSQFHRFREGFLQALLRFLFTFLWSLLFVIPGIVKAYSYAMTPFIMAEHPQLTAREAIDASKELMDGHKMELFLLSLSFIGWEILAVLALGIGQIFLNPYINAAYAAFYRNLTKPVHTASAEYL